MPRRTLFTLFIASLALLTACAPPTDEHEAVSEEAIALFAQTPGILAQVQDVDSALEAKEKLEEIAEQFGPIGEQLRDLGPVRQTDADRIDADMESRMMPVVAEIEAEMERIAQLGPAVLTPIQSAMITLGTAMQNVEKTANE